jgi:sulfate transport system permease protein
MAQVRARKVLPGFGLSLGYTLAYMSLIVLIPLAAVFIRSTELSFDSFWDILRARLDGAEPPPPADGRRNFWEVVTAPEVMASYRLSFGASLAAAAINVVFGFLLAWSLVRYSFPGKRLLDAMVDMPFALPTAVAGISLAALYAENGWLGQYLAPIGIQVAFTPLGVLIALVFIGLPFVVRTVQPVLQDLDTELEEAAASLGAGRWQTMWRVVLPTLLPALLTGFALAFARAVGEYGSVIFIAGNIPMVSEITPHVIFSRLEQYDYAGATAVAVVMLVVSFLLLLVINGLQSWSDRRAAKGG